MRLALAMMLACGGSNASEPPPPAEVTTGAEPMETTGASPEVPARELSFDCNGDVEYGPVRSAVREVHRGIRACYVVPALAQVPAVRIDVTVRIEPDGTASRVATSLRTEHDEPYEGGERLQACVADQLRTLDFGRVEGDCAVFRMPIVFAPPDRSP